MIEQFGWSDALRRDFSPHAAAGLTPGRVIAQHRGLWILATDLGELPAEVTGRFAQDAEPGAFPAVGDFVAAQVLAAPSRAVIRTVLPRRTAFVRRAAGKAGGEQVVAANIDVAFLVTSLNADFNPRRMERYLALAWQSGATPVVVLTKADLAPDAGAAVIEAEALAVGAEVLAVSAVTGEGMDGVKAHLAPGRTVCLVGSSGVGKSTLVNALAGAERMIVKAIRAGDERGRHTTTHRELVLLPGGGLILDTPGMRELGVLGEEEGVSTAFADIEALAAACRFSDCGHGNEPGCAVAAAMEAGDLDADRWRSWRKLQREIAFEEAKEDPAIRAARRRRWVGIAKANRRRERSERDLLS